MTTCHHTDDLPPEHRPLVDPLRRRALAMGCTCRPGITVDTAMQRISVEHLPSCPALRHSESVGGHEILRVGGHELAR